jgi:polyphosphate kinase 2 (PPK2 family)
MLEKVDLSRALTKEEAEPKLKKLQERLRILQQAALNAPLAVTLVLEGWDSAGKGTLVGKLVERLDPRGFKVRSTHAALEEELYRPWLWRFWMKLPAYGEIVVFDRSWYGRVGIERVEKLARKDEVERAFQEINDFERALTDDGQVLVKCFLHITKKEQRRRFDKAEDDFKTRWKIQPEDWRRHGQYAEYHRVYEEMLERTSTTDAPWTVIEAMDKRWATVAVFTRLVEAMEKQLKAMGKLPGATRLSQVIAKPPKPKPSAKPMAKKGAA